MIDQLFPTGKFTYTVGEYAPVIEIAEQGKMFLSLGREVIVVSKYQVMGDIVEVEDVEGSYASPEYGIGRYRWHYDWETIYFELIEDKLPSRLKAFAVPWRRVDRSSMPYYFEGNLP